MSRQPVLDYYTDENLNAQLSSPEPGVVLRSRQLLSVPAEARQAVAIEVSHLTVRSSYVEDANGELMVSQSQHGSFDEAYDRVVAGYLAGAPFTSNTAQDYDPRR